MNCKNVYMEKAILQAREALKIGEVPVGAVIVDSDGTVLAERHNLREAKNDPLGHAELLAIGDAAKKLGKWRLAGCSIYVTVEPCPMCAGAIQQARLDSLIYGCDDPKAGAAGSLYNIPQDERFAHWVKVAGGICEEECKDLLQQFFKSKRNS